MLTYPEKLPPEEVMAEFDFTARIKAIDPALTLASCTTEIVVQSGGAADTNPSAMKNGGVAISGNIVGQPIKGGVEYVNYAINFNAVLSNGMKISEQGLIPVVRFRKA